MLLLLTDALPSGDQWLYELKLDGYRAIAFKRQGALYLRSRNNKDFSARYPAVVTGLAKLPDNTAIDGESVAFDQDGRPSFNGLQNYGSAPAPVVYYVFDVLVLAGRDVMHEPLEARRELLERKVLPKLAEPIRYASPLDADLPTLVAAVKAQGFEGMVAKRRTSVHEPGQRSGAWQKMRMNRGQEFVIGGHTHGTSTFDALIFGYYHGDDLIYVARTGTALRRPSAGSCSRSSSPSAPTSACSPTCRRRAAALGAEPHEGEDGRVPVATAGARRAIRVSGVDGRQSSQAFQVRRPPRGQEREGRGAGVKDHCGGRAIRERPAVTNSSSLVITNVSIIDPVCVRCRPA
jgi:bifunctional non-homologous end joining protein LigD